MKLHDGYTAVTRCIPDDALMTWLVAEDPQDASLVLLDGSTDRTDDWVIDWMMVVCRFAGKTLKLAVNWDRSEILKHLLWEYGKNAGKAKPVREALQRCAPHHIRATAY